MLKNTYYLILFLSILAALVVGLNIGKKMQGQTSDTSTVHDLPSTISPTPSLSTGTPTSSPSSSATKPTASNSGTLQKTTLYTNTECAVSLSYPDTVTLSESSTKTLGAVFTHKTNPKDVIVLTCQKEIPRPPLTAENIEEFKVGTLSGKLYHDGSAKDGTRMDALIFTHPKTGLDVFIGGFGEVFNGMIKTVKIL